MYRSSTFGVNEHYEEGLRVLYGPHGSIMQGGGGGIAVGGGGGGGGLKPIAKNCGKIATL